MIILIIFIGFLLFNSILYSTIKSTSIRNNANSITLNLNYTENQETVADFHPNSVKINSAFLAMDSNRSAQNVCVLPIYDIWHNDIKRAIKDVDPTRNCDKNFIKWTELENSTWRIIKKGADCKARCFEGVGYTKNVVFSEWIPPGKVDCEFLETVCSENGEDVYGYIHTQVIPKPRYTLKPKSEHQPNVFVLTIDSMNTGMARRSLPQFLDFFQSNLSGIEFPFVNKVGENSKPNAVSLWFGKSLDPARKVSWDELKADVNRTEFCETCLDNYTSIFKDFKSEGYATILLEDCMNTVMDSYPTCVGFKEAPADHTFHPFASVHERFGATVTRNHLNGSFCRELYHALFDVLQQGIDQHKDRPLFSHTWSVHLSHDHVNGVARADQYLLDFFRRNQKVFDDSFVLLVADHGFRIGGHTKTETGKFERDNPHLAISIPKRYRSEKFGILETLKTNSRQLQTHYDTRATLLDIVKYQPDANFMDRESIDIPNEKGNSLIRRQPDFVRTCGTLPIPRQFCICQVEKREIIDESLKSHLGQRLLDHVHDLLEEENFATMCEEYSIKEVVLIEYGYTKSWNTYSIEVKTELPASAHFQTVMTYDNAKNITSFEKVLRLDRYGKTIACTEKIRDEPLCYCKNQTTTTN